MVMWLIPILVMLIVTLSEILHLRRCIRLGRLAFGPHARPRSWTYIVPPLRVLSLGALIYCLMILMNISGIPRNTTSEKTKKMQIKHLMIALDVSPSMEIKDAGVAGGQSRAIQARKLLKSMMERVDMTDVRVTIIPFYSKAMPLIVDTFDPEVVNNVLDGLPLDYAFNHGKTNMYEAVNVASDIAKPWASGSAVLVVVSDGDTLPTSGMDVLPPAITDVMVIGVGNKHRGTFIDGHASKQDMYSLKRLALQLRGLYHDGNTQHIPSADLANLSKSLPVKNSTWKDMRFLALLGAGISASILALISPMLALFGTPWRSPAATIKQHNSLTAPQGAC